MVVGRYFDNIEHFSNVPILPIHYADNIHYASSLIILFFAF